MSWLAPLFLAGFAAIALPIWLHRLQTETPKRQAFSSAMLLLQAERRVHVKRRLRYWLLLALRIALLAMLALAFAKPLWMQPPAALSHAEAKLHVLLIDTSMSMQEGSRWAAVVEQAHKIVSQASATDRLQLIAAGDELQVMAGPLNATAEGKEKILNMLSKMRAGSSQLQYGAMMTGLESLLAQETQSTVAHVISDFQHSALPAQFGELVPRTVNGRATAVLLHNIVSGEAPNFTVTQVERVGTAVQVEVQGLHTQATTLTVELLVNGISRGVQSMAIAASGVTTFQFDKVALNTGNNKVEAKIRSADTLPVDDVFYTVLENTMGQPVPFLSANPPGVTAKYVDAAFTAAGSRYALQPVKLEQFDVRTLDRYRFVVIDDLGAINERLATALDNYLQKGGAVFAAVGERSQLVKTLPLVKLSVGTMHADQQGERMTVANIDVNHAALSGATALRSVNVVRYLQITPNADSRLLVQLDNGAPLLLEQRQGQGRVLLFTSGLDNTWNDLPIQPVFVSLLTESARYLAGETLLKRQQRVGSALPLEQATAAGQVIDPQGKNLLSLSDSQQARSVKLEMQGIYEVVTVSGSSLVAVNAVPDESNLMPMSEEEFTNWQQVLSAQPQHAINESGAVSSELPKGYELWHVLLVLLALFVLAESLLGNTYVSRRVEAPT